MRRVPYLVCAVIILVSASSSQAWAAGWKLQTTPNPSANYNALTAVTTTSASNAWAVGYEGSNLGSSEVGLIEHYTGAWSVDSLPTAPGGLELWGVKATSASNVWAVGFTSPQNLP
ncbi:MAG TPA: hypothetical protein VGH10_03085, partial [Actinomycetota bacterium]